jgi:peroxiredoxin
VATEEPESTGPRFGDIAPDFTLPDSNGNEVSLGETLQENEQVVIVFYIGVGCTPCMAQLREIENDRVKYEEKGAHVIAIAVQSEENAEFTRKTVQAQFPILADYRDVAKAYGVFELRFPILDEGVSTPSVFIIDKDQQIVWSEITHVEGCGTERVPSQTILEKLR